jgi:hypothetical protein
VDISQIEFASFLFEKFPVHEIEIIIPSILFIHRNLKARIQKVLVGKFVLIRKLAINSYRIFLESIIAKTFRFPKYVKELSNSVFCSFAVNRLTPLGHRAEGSV